MGHNEKPGSGKKLQSAESLNLDSSGSSESSPLPSTEMSTPAFIRSEQTISDSNMLERARLAAQPLLPIGALEHENTPSPSGHSDTLFQDSFPAQRLKDTMQSALPVTSEESIVPRSLSFDPLYEQLIANRYRVEGLLGEGGMGCVYRVKDLELDEIVALKMLHPNLLENTLAVERFKREVKLARRVTHPNVARTFDIGMHEGTFFLTMEFIEGESLGSYIDREGAMSIDEMVSISKAMCEGLLAAHSAHIVHRDLKPGNILLCTDGRVVLSDFGIAGVDIHSGKSGATGSPLGTPSYMSPEQLEGRQDIDLRADIYSLGLIFYELLSGQRAWFDNNPFTLAFRRLSGEDPKPLSTFRNDLTAQLLDLIKNCLVWDRNNRFQRVSELILLLEQQEKQEKQEKQETIQQELKLPEGQSFVTHQYKRARWSSFLKKAVPTQFGERRLAVLPFEGGNDAFLSEGLSEDLVDLLTMLPGIRVRPLRFVRPLLKESFSTEEFADRLDVDDLIEGSIRMRGEECAIRVRLLSATDGYQRWARRFQCRESEIFTMSETIVAALADALTIEAEPVARLRTQNAEAIELYFRARFEQRRNWYGDLSSSVALFDKALALEPNDPLILVGAAMTYARHTFYLETARETDFVFARMLAERAIHAAPERGEPYFALALIRYYNLETTSSAIDALCTALERAPSFPEANSLLGRILLEIGPIREGIVFQKKALAIDPLMLNIRWDLMRAYALLGKWDFVDQLGDLPVEHSDDLMLRTIMRSRLDLWRETPHWNRGDIPDLPPDSGFLGLAINSLLSIRETNAFSLEIMEMVEDRLKNSGVRRLQLAVFQPIAECLVFIGEYEKAIDTIELLIKQGLIDYMWLTHCPLFVSLYPNPRFQECGAVLEKRIKRIHNAV